MMVQFVVQVQLAAIVVIQHIMPLVQNVVDLAGRMVLHVVLVLHVIFAVTVTNFGIVNLSQHAEKSRVGVMVQFAQVEQHATNVVMDMNFGMAKELQHAEMNLVGVVEQLVLQELLVTTVAMVAIGSGVVSV